VWVYAPALFDADSCTGASSGSCQPNVSAASELVGMGLNMSLSPAQDLRISWQLDNKILNKTWNDGGWNDRGFGPISPWLSCDGDTILGRYTGGEAAECAPPPAKGRVACGSGPGRGHGHQPFSPTNGCTAALGCCHSPIKEVGPWCIPMNVSNNGTHCGMCATPRPRGAVAGQPAVCSGKHSGQGSSTAVFIGAPRPPVSLWRALVKTAGVHLYTADADSVDDGDSVHADAVETAVVNAVETAVVTKRNRAATPKQRWAWAALPRRVRRSAIAIGVPATQVGGCVRVGRCGLCAVVTLPVVQHAGSWAGCQHSVLGHC
jgi:hypothetical protein